MNLATIQKFCAALPQAKAETKWEVDYVHTIGGKMFAVTFEDKIGNARVSFKVDSERFLELTDRAGFIPAPYLARAKWVQITDLRKVKDAELKALITRSYQLIAMKLTKKHRRELGLAE